MELTQVILEVLIVVLGLYMAFFKSYFSEHGKQLALKEHIEELTKKVETVKAEINFFTQTKFDLGTNERNAILDYHSKYFDWRNSVLALFPSVINKNNCDSWEQFIDEVRIKELFTQNADERLNLFDNSTKLIEIKKNTKIACMEIQHDAERVFSKVSREYMIYNIKMKVAEQNTQLELQKEHYDKIEVLNNEFRKRKLDSFAALVLLENSLNDYLREQLFKEVE